ncbi:hypothetical protein F25303_9548 [Fusarium sp. NRRL 25303]|nr:hypothetical protein F25303_9548 [Fusarium sp. NRRL 25303]
MLHGHPITSFLLFQAAFIQSLSTGPDFPQGFHRERYIQMLDARSLQDRRRTNDVYHTFKKARRLGSKLAGWKYLIRAQQYTYHPMLAKLKFEREALATALHHNKAMGAMDEGDQAVADQLTKWKTRLEPDENWPYLVG